MFSHKAFLKIGDTSAADFMSLVKGGYEISNCEFSFQQGFDDTGKVSTKVYGGTIVLTLPMLPPSNIIEWGLNSRNYNDGIIVTLDDENIPQEKILFTNAACVNMSIDYTQQGETYSFTKLVIHAETLVVGNSGLTFDNEWVK